MTIGIAETEADMLGVHGIDDIDVGNDVGNDVGSEAGTARTRRPVLIVDDDTTIRDVVSFMLERLDYNPVTVTNGKEALDAMQESTFRIVLMDVHMPEMDGIEATKRIRAQLSDDHQPSIIAMTANSTFEEQFVCIKAGMNYFLPKPIRLDHLAAALEQSGSGTS